MSWLCSVCHKVATGSVNVTANGASSVPSVFESRCDDHNPYAFQITRPARRPAVATEQADPPSPAPVIAYPGDGEPGTNQKSRRQGELTAAGGARTDVWYRV